MKKLYRKNVVHPTPPAVSDHLLYLLPATLLTLTAALSSEEREVLAYLISCCSSSNNHRKIKKTTGKVSNSVDHQPCFNCYCFRCYTSYWVKWDSSPNRQVIHEIIDDFEDGLLNENNKKEKGKKHKSKGKAGKEKVKVSVELDQVKTQQDDITNYGDTNNNNDTVVNVVVDDDEAIKAAADSVEEEEMEKGSIRSFVSFVGERIWGVWG